MIKVVNFMWYVFNYSLRGTKRYSGCCNSLAHIFKGLGNFLVTGACPSAWLKETVNQPEMSPHQSCELSVIRGKWMRQTTWPCPHGAYGQCGKMGGWAQNISSRGSMRCHCTWENVISPLIARVLEPSGPPFRKALLRKPLQDIKKHRERLNDFITAADTSQTPRWWTSSFWNCCWKHPVCSPSLR